MKPIKSISNSLNAKVNKISDNLFKQRVKALYDSMTEVHASVLKYIKMYLVGQMGNTPFPKVRTGNLLRNIMYEKIKISKIKYSKIGANLSAEFTVSYFIDSTPNGNPLVKSRKQGRPYARYLNYSKLFPEYNGFFDKISDEYREDFLDRVNTKAKKLFSKNEYYRY